MISPPAANLIVRNGEEIRGCGRITVYQRSSRVYIGTLSLCEPTIEGDHWSQGTVFGGRSPILASLGFHFFAAVSRRSDAYCLPAEAKTSFESPVSALHAKPLLPAGFCWIWDGQAIASKEKMEEENSHRLLFDKSDIRLSVPADNLHKLIKRTFVKISWEHGSTKHCVMPTLHHCQHQYYSQKIDSPSQSSEGIGCNFHISLPILNPQTMPEKIYPIPPSF